MSARKAHPFVCVLCSRHNEPAGPGSTTCTECAAELDRRFDAAHEAFEALTPEEKRAAGDEVFARIARNLPASYHRARER